MTNYGSTALKGGGGGGGIACLLRQFETRIDAGSVFERPQQKPNRPGSLRGQWNVLKTALEPVGQSNPVMLTPKGSKATTTNTSKATDTSVQSPAVSLPSSSGRTASTTPVTTEKKSQTPPEDLKIEDHDNNNSQQATAAEDKFFRKDSVDENDPEKMEKLSTSSPSPGSPKDSESTLDEEKQLSTAGVNNRSSENNIALTTESDPCNSAVVPISDPINPGSNPTPVSLKDSNVVEKTAVKGNETRKVIGTRFIFKQSSKENQNDTVYLDGATPSPSTPNKVKQLARSMDNLCSSTASTPTKELNIFHVDTAIRNAKWNTNPPSTAPAVILSSTNNEKTPPIRAKRPPPPPVPKKNLKVNREVEGHDLDSVTDQSHVMPRVGDSQTLPNLNQVSKPARPTTLFPEESAVNGEDETSNGKYKSLPILGNTDVDTYEEQVLPIMAQKNTLFPCNRQKNRSRIVSRESEQNDDHLNSTSDHAILSGHSVDPFVSSPDVDSFIDRQDHDSNPSASNLSPIHPPTTEIVFTKSHCFTQSSSKATDDFVSLDVFDSDLFLSDAFDFLGNSADSVSKVSPLKSWTDTWTRATQKRLSKTSDGFVGIGDSAKELSGDPPDKMKPQAEKAVTSRPRDLQNAEMISRIRSSGRDVKTKADDKSGEEAVTKPTTHFGVVLRRNDAPSLLLRRSSHASSFASKEDASNAAKAYARPTTIIKSTESFRTSGKTPLNLNGKPSALPLTNLPLQKSTPKIFGKSIGGRASFLLNRTSVSDVPVAELVSGRGTKEVATIHELESDSNVIDRAFSFLDRSGA